MKIFILFFILSFSLFAQTKLGKQIRSAYEGNEFVVAFMQNEILIDGNSVDQKILISSRYNTSATMFLPDGSNQVFNISPSKSEKIKVPMYYMNSTSEVVVRKNIIIKSDKSISVTGYSSQFLSSDMFAVIPTSRWGTEYQAITMGIDHYATTDSPSGDPFLAAPRSGEFMIIANEDNTVVEFTPRKETKSHPANQKVTIILNKWESYLVQAAGTQTKTANDLSGSIIRANKKIGVLSGHMRTAVPPKLEEASSDSKDHIVEMLNPSEYFGTEYVTAPFGQGIQSLFAITTLKEKADVKILTNEGTINVTLGFPGAVKYVRVDSAAKWSSDSSFQLGQFMARFADEGDTCNELYDPAFVIIQPADYFNNNLNFLSVGYNESAYNYAGRQTSCGEDHKNRQYVSHYAIIIAKDGARQNTLIDGISYPVSYFTGTIPGTDYYYGYVELTPGEHKIESMSGGILATLYGYGYFDSYAYSLGSAFLKNNNNDTIPPIVSSYYDCDSFDLLINEDDIYKSGLQYVDVNSNSDNIVVIENRKSDNNASVKVLQKDKRKDAYVSIDYYDNAGNGMNINHYFKGVNPITSDVNLGQITYQPNKEYSFEVKNGGTQEIEIKNITFDSNDFILKEAFTEFTLQANETKQIAFFINSSDISNIAKSNKIFVEAECNVIDTAELNLEIVNYELSGLGYDFGEILIGDKECNNIYFQNLGDLKLTLTGVEFEQSRITLDTNGLFPVDLKKDEILNILVCTQPMDSSHTKIDVKAIGYGIVGVGADEERVNVSKTVEVKDIGIGAYFESIEYDFGNVYVGFEKSKSLEIKNTGSHYGIPVFETIIIYNDTLSSKNTIAAKDSITDKRFETNVPSSFEFYFKPQKSGNYTNIYYFSYRQGILPRAFNIILRGNALTSEFTNNTYCFDTLYTIDSSLKNVRLFSYNGDTSRNVYLIRPYKLYFSELNNPNIDEIDLNENPFEFINFDYSSTINNNEQINADIQFKPTKQGYYKLEILLITNSLEDGKLFDSLTTTICGVGVDPVYPNATFSINNSDIWACDTSQVSAEIENTGATDIIINKIYYESQYNSKLNIDNITLPYELKVNNSIEMPIDVFLKRGEVDNLKLFAEATDFNNDFATTFTQEFNLEPLTKQLELPDLDFSVNINDTASIDIYGDIPYDIDIPTKMTLEIEVDYNVLWLISDKADLIVTNSSGEKKTIQVNIINEYNVIKFDIPFFEFDLSGDVRWDMKLNFLVLLSDKFTTELKVKAKSDECFDENSATYPVKIDEVCAQNFRLVGDFGLNSINSSYNNLKNQVNIDLKTSISTNISIYLIDMLGKKLDLCQNLFVNKGNYFLNYDLNFIPNGNYFLVVDTKINRVVTNIIILK